MPRALKITVGQFSDKGRKDTNQDFHGALIPEEPLLGLDLVEYRRELPAWSSR